MRLGYYAYGMIDHSLLEAVELLCELSYGSIVLPLGPRLSPRISFAERSTSIIDGIVELKQHVASVGQAQLILDTSLPYILDVRSGTSLSLCCSAQETWSMHREALEWAIRLSHRLGSAPLIARSGTASDAIGAEQALDQMAEHFEELLPLMDSLDVDLALQPHEEHFIHNVHDFQRLTQWIDSPRLKLAVDTASMFRQIEFPLISVLGPMRDRLVHVTFRDPTLPAPSGDWISQGSIRCEAVVECLREMNFEGNLLIYSWPSDHRALDTAQLIRQHLHDMIG